ncbi:MAG: complex I NDUFA9 subunit family protein [Pseudomonadota bacterium]
MADTNGGIGTRAPLATIFGGSGFVGRYAVRALAKRGWRVRAAVRRPDLAGHLQVMGFPGQVHPVQANVRNAASVAAAIDGASAVVNLVGILAASGKQTFEALQLEGARTIAEAAAARDVDQLVQVSAIGADAQSKARYARTKAEGEQAVLAAFPGAVILRPSIIFGPEDEFFNRFAEMATMSPLLPLIGGGQTRFQPVYVGDVAEAVALACEGKAEPGTTYELGGPEIASFKTLLERTLAWSGRERGFASLPFGLAKLSAAMTKPLPSGLRPLTVDQVRMLQTDNVVSKAALEEKRTLEGLGITAPTAMGSVVPGYLERFQPRGQFSNYRG